MTKPHKVPCTILTGCWGSGKTTLLNHIIQSLHGKSIAIIENELGEVGIDHMALQGKDVIQIHIEENIFEATCGCLCRKMRGDLIRCLKRLRKTGGSLDHLLIETTGLADPATLVQTFFADEFVAEVCSLDGILTLVDTKRLVQQLNDAKDCSAVANNVAKQVAYADMILLNKIDLVDKETMVQAKARIRQLNPSAPIRLASHSQIDMTDIIGIDGWSLHKVLDTDEGFLEGTIHSAITCHLLEDLVKGFNMAGEEVFAIHVPTEEEPFGPWLWRAAKEQITKGRLHLVQTNGDDIWVEPVERFVSSVGIDFQGEVDKEKFDNWMSEVMMEGDENLFRYKGILAMQGHNTPYVFQGMQTRIIEAGHNQRDWPADDQKRCKIHFMGNNLNRDQLVKGFMDCVPMEPPLTSRSDRSNGP